MRTLTDSEKRTIRYGAIGIAVYLAFFGWRYLEARRAEYRQMVNRAEVLKLRLQPYEDKALLVQKLMEDFQLDPAKLKKASLVGQASEAIQNAAAAGGIQFGPIRESAGRGSAKELASMKLEGTGPLPAVMKFLEKLSSVGYPVVVETVQISANPMAPGAVKLSLTITILDFDQWKSEEMPDV